MALVWGIVFILSLLLQATLQNVPDRWRRTRFDPIYQWQVSDAVKEGDYIYFVSEQAVFTLDCHISPRSSVREIVVSWVSAATNSYGHLATWYGFNGTILEEVATCDKTGRYSCRYTEDDDGSQYEKWISINVTSCDCHSHPTQENPFEACA